MSSWIHWISSQTGTLLDTVQEWINELYSSPDTRSDDDELSYYEELLDDLQHLEIESQNSISSLKDKIQTLKLEVRYILPYMTCCPVTKEKAYRETKRHFRIKNCQKGSAEFIEYMMEQILLVKPDSTDFYIGASIGECNWSKFTDCVMDNLKYVQCLDDNLAVYSKEQLKPIEESLWFVRYFIMLVSKWNFGKLDNAEADIHDIYESMGSASRDTALIFQLFTVQNSDGSKTGRMDMGLSEVQEKVYGCELRAKEAYFDILTGMKLCLPDTCPLKSETLYSLIDSLQNNLLEVSTYLHDVKNSREGDMQDMIKEIEFMKSILKGSLDDLAGHGKLDAMATHIDVLACEAGSAVYAFLRELEELTNHETRVKVLSLVEKIKLTKHEIRLTNKKDESFLHNYIEDFLDSLKFFLVCEECKGNDGLDLGNARNGLRMIFEHPVVLELRFLQAFLRCTQKWCIDHPQLQGIRISTEDMVRHTWWDIRCLSFKRKMISEEVASEKLEFLLSCMVQNLLLHRPKVQEICTKIRDSMPSSSCCLCKKFGLDLADAQCEFLESSDSPKQCMALDMAVLFGRLHLIAGNLLVNRKRPNGLLIFLEDLMDRAACLSYLQLVGNANGITSLKQLLIEIEDLEVSIIYYTIFAWQISKLPSSVLPSDLDMLGSVNVLTHFFKELIRTQASIVTSMRDHIEDVLRDLILVRCILTDPLKEYFKREELDELLNDIGAAVIEAGVFFFFSRVSKSKVNIFFRVKDVVRCFRATVSQVYSKFSNLSPSKLAVFDTGSLNILLWNLMKLFNSNDDSTGFPAKQIQELQNDLQVCNSFLGDTKLKKDEVGMTERLRARIMSIGIKIESSISTFDEVPLWFFKMRLPDLIEEVKLVKEEIIEMGLRPLADVSSSDKMSSKVLGTGPKAQDEVIGFEDEEEQLIRQLTTSSQLVQVISIVGVPGSGKTTLAMKVYETVARSFHCRAWCYVSQNYQKKRLLQQIINDIEGPTEDTKDLSEEDLAQRLYESLMKKKDYLVVLDDVWDIEVWNQLRACFPRGNNRNKILLTSRSKDFVLDASISHDYCISLNPISRVKSRLLLEKRAFGTKSFPEHLHDIGVEIADKCGGLPLSLVLVAGLLKNIEEKELEWVKVSKNLDSLVQNHDDVLNKLELSYKHLPIHLKLCFLYCGALISRPICRGEIRRSKLVGLWVAERLIEETGEKQRLEEVAERCLMDLISRSFLIVSKRGSDGRVRTCRVHDLLRDFCIRKGHGEQFLLTRLDVLKPFPHWQQRVCVCLHKLVEVKHSKWCKPRTRTLIHSECGLGCMFANHGPSSCILEKFTLLNVLDLESANMGDTFPLSITGMTLLRYLAVGVLVNSIPSAVIKLTNLETLIVKGNRDGIQLPDTIFELKKLRHLVVGPHTHFTSTSINSSDCPQLETLETVIFCCCDVCKDTIPRLKKRLRKLKCILRGSIKHDGFPDLDSLSHLEYLKTSYSGLAPPFLCKFRLPDLPVNLKKITLSGFELNWSEMGSISDLPHVEYLKLHDGAFKGKKWETEHEFPSLKYLRLDNLEIQEWEASEEHFPYLEWLVVRRCKWLKAIPPEFSDIVTLKCVEVDQCGPSVGDSAVQIEEKQRKFTGNKHFRSIISRVEEMVHIGDQANKDKLCSNIALHLAFHYLLIVWMQSRNSD